MTDSERQPARRRRRRRSGTGHTARADQTDPSPTGTSQPTDSDRQPDAGSASPPPGTPGSGRRAKKTRTDPAERNLRAIVGAGPSQLGVEGALRGRDVNRPSPQDLADAERDVVIVRRRWTPPESE